MKTAATATAENKNLKNETMATGVEIPKKVENEKITPFFGSNLKKNFALLWAERSEKKAEFLLLATIFTKIGRFLLVN